ncbi:hypothetical protein PIB30_073812 [Stylosanthes scabra]|uniref:Uncharacterized protein n=1 Tax=Stylosanthes scabra TaxID=79078 RepID=A0ABU6XNE3_9FABA|nr:hypothetical protein [Stylosanthes scabra]
MEGGREEFCGKASGTRQDFLRLQPLTFEDEEVSGQLERSESEDKTRLKGTRWIPSFLHTAIESGQEKRQWKVDSRAWEQEGNLQRFWAIGSGSYP